MVPYYSLSLYTSMSFFTHTNAINLLILTLHLLPHPFKDWIPAFRGNPEFPLSRE
jgi:hypothetical protein